MQEYQNEAQRRRKARLAKKARMQRRRRSVGLIAAAVVLVVLVLLFGGRGAQQPEDPVETTLPPQTTEPQQTNPQQTTPQQPDEPVSQTGSTVIHVAVAGDLNVTDYVLENAAHENGYDFSGSFLDVAPILKALKAIGVDAVQTANSAAIRQGVSGLVTTLDAFEHVGLTSLGTYADAADFRRSGGYEIVEVNGIRIALIAFTKGMDNLGLPAGSEDCVNLLYKDYSTDYKKVDTERIARVLREVSEEQPDITIAMLHWGSEYNDEISASQEKIRKQLQEGGVDIIVGSHPHLVQKVAYDSVAHTLVAYSLGDFFGDAAMAGTNYSVILELQITKLNSTGECYLSGWDYTPIFTLKPEQSNIGGHRVVRIREAMERYELDFVGRINEETYGDMEYALKRIEERINPKPEE